MRTHTIALALSFATLATAAHSQTAPVLTGQAAFTDYSKEKPGVRRHLTLADLPKPMPESSVTNRPELVPRPEGAWPQAPAGFKVTEYATGDFVMPRLVRPAPNGDIFLADSGGGRDEDNGRVIVLRGVGADGKAAQREVFATNLDHPFGIAFFPADNPKWVYVANTTSVVRFPYKAGDMKASGPAEVVVRELPGYAKLTGGGHWTRDVVFTKDGQHMLISVGSASNVDDSDTHPTEFHRADVLEFTPDGKFEKIYAAGIRNCVGEAINPITGALWCSTNERDGLGDNLVPDYITSVPEDSFFGWPWWYMGGHQDPRHAGKHPELKDKVRTPDVILEPHFASLQMSFYPNINKRDADHAGNDFPVAFAGDAFAAEHGSWNRSKRTGYEVIRVPMKNGKATGEYEDFLTGFVTADGKVWGRPVGVTAANDGALIVTDDGSKTVWRVAYVGKK
ncbi:PQQ-dependent sugar dehydrogenase [Granulicella cerasi]|nr:PQQ-dependent sugar dehydrogenase [Granulicella cerasi]